MLFLTAKTQDSDVVTGMALGANDYLESVYAERPELRPQEPS